MNKSKMIRVTAVLILVTLIATITVSVAAANNGQITVTDVFKFDPFPTPGEQVPQAQAILLTDEAGARLRLKTAELTPGDAVTIWWVIFNQPEACAAYPTGACGLDDLANPDVAAEITYATGNVINHNGKVRFSAQLEVGHTAQEWFGNGFTNPTGAEIHVVVRSHGQVIPELLDDMLGTFRGGCQDDEVITPDHPAYEDGTPGPNQCVDLQFAVFQQ
jgi:hypothetical protein